MKKLILITIFFCLIFMPTNNIFAAPGDIIWGNLFGGPLKEQGYSVQQTTDGGFIIAGVTYSYGLGNADFYLVKTDTNGNELWSNTFGSPFEDFPKSVQQTTDGGYIITGYTHPPSGADVYLIKADANGNELWSKSFGGPSSSYGSSVQETTDGGFIIAGYTNPPGLSNYDIYLIKTDANGNETWSKTFNYGADYAYSVRQTTDGGFIVAGRTGRDAFLLKTDTNGNMDWSKTYSSGSYRSLIGYSVQQTTDGGFIMAGENAYNVLLLKADGNGNEVWRKTYGGKSHDLAASIRQTPDGGFIVTGGTRSFGAGAEDVFVLKTDTTGNIVWVKTYGLSSFEAGYSILQSTDGSFVVTGETFSYGSNYQIFLLKIKP